jgi:hypothetical protein
MDEPPSRAASAAQPSPSRPPLLAVRRERAARHDVVHVGMVLQLPSPRMLAAQVPRLDATAAARRHSALIANAAEAAQSGWSGR